MNGDQSEAQDLLVPSQGTGNVTEEMQTCAKEMLGDHGPFFLELLGILPKHAVRVMSKEQLQGLLSSGSGADKLQALRNRVVYGDIKWCVVDGVFNATRQAIYVPSSAPPRCFSASVRVAPGQRTPTFSFKEVGKSWNNLRMRGSRALERGHFARVLSSIMACFLLICRPMKPTDATSEQLAKAGMTEVDARKLVDEVTRAAHGLGHSYTQNPYDLLKLVLGLGCVVLLELVASNIPLSYGQLPGNVIYNMARAFHLLGRDVFQCSNRWGDSPRPQGRWQKALASTVGLGQGFWVASLAVAAMKALLHLMDPSGVDGELYKEYGHPVVPTSSIKTAFETNPLLGILGLFALITVNVLLASGLAECFDNFQKKDVGEYVRSLQVALSQLRVQFFPGPQERSSRQQIATKAQTDINGICEKLGVKIPMAEPVELRDDGEEAARRTPPGLRSGV